MVPELRYNPALDGLRAYAVGLVVLAHLPPIQGVGAMFAMSRAAEGLRLGFLGVDIFFVLSGFLVTSILLADKQQERFSFARFYAKRTLRIFPIFYLTLLFCALVFPLASQEVAANALYLSNYFYVFHDNPSPLRHTWSLAVEEQFYLLWPLVLYFVPIRRIGLVLAIAVPVVVGISLVIAWQLVEGEHFGRLVTRGAMFRVLSLGAGALLAVHAPRLRTLKLGPIVFLGLTAGWCYLVSLLLEDKWRHLVGLVCMSTIAVCIFCAAYVGYMRRTALSRWLLEARPIVYLGKISYGIYLYHFVILYALGARQSENPDGVGAGTLLAFIGLSIVVPMLSFQFIESPILRMKERFNRPSRNAGRPDTVNP